MAETFAALLFAHALADIAIRPRWLAARDGTLPAALLRAVLALLIAWAAAGFPFHPALPALAVLHLAVSTLDGRVAGRGVAGFLLTETLRLATLLGIAAAAPGLYAGGLWSGPPAALAAHPAAAILPHLPAAMAYAAGAILATLAGGMAVGRLLIPFLEAEPKLTEDSLRDAGRLIGLLERGLAFFLVTVGEAAGVGLLLAAKSVLRFSTATHDRKISEYIIIGTLASLGWALVTGFATLALVALLP